SSCKYHIKNEYANNCLLAYCNYNQANELSAAEISFLYDIPYGELQSKITNLHEKLRHEAFKVAADEDPELERQFTFIESDKLCCNCGSSIEENEKIAIEDTPIAFCSEGCEAERNPYIVRLEYEYGVPIR